MIYLFYIVEKISIHKIKFIVEAYENMMQVSTVDEAAGKIQIMVAPDSLQESLAILEDLATQIPMEKIEDDPNATQGNF